jgi:hypothetical protein
MPKPAVTSRTGRFAFIALLVFAGTALVAGTATGGSIKPKNGAYLQSPAKAGQNFGYVSTEAGKIAGGGGGLTFRDRTGKACVPEGLYASGGKVSFAFVAKRKVRPDRRNRFVISVKRSAYTPTLRGTVSGKMLSRNRARFTISLTAGNCKARGTFTNATYVSGG